MLCEQCNRQTSTVLLTRVTDGVTSRRQLCRACAEPLLDRIQPGEITGATYLSPPRANEEPLPAEIRLPDSIAVRELASALALQPFQVIGTLLRMKVLAASRDTINFATASALCERYGVKPAKVNSE